METLDLLEAMRADWPALGDTVLRVDGGMVASDWTMQRLADILAAPVDRPDHRVARSLRVPQESFEVDRRGFADLRFVQDWLGHRNIQNTVVYTFLTARGRDSAARTVFLQLPRF